MTRNLINNINLILNQNKKLILMISLLLFLVNNLLGQVMLEIDDVTINEFRKASIEENILLLSRNSASDKFDKKNNFSKIIQEKIGVTNTIVNIRGSNKSIIDVLDLKDFLLRLSLGEYPNIKDINVGGRKELDILLEMGKRETKLNSLVELSYIIPDKTIESQLKEEIIQNLMIFNECLDILISDESPERKASAFKLADVLFLDSRVNTIEVSSLYNQRITQYRVFDYLKRLENLPYNQVKISWNKESIKINPNFYQESENAFIGTATIVQRFSAIKGNRPYRDITSKRIEFRIERKRIMLGRRAVFTWKMHFTNINVVETR